MSLARVEDDGDSIVRDDITMIAAADPGKEHFKVDAFVPSGGTRYGRDCPEPSSAVTIVKTVRRFEAVVRNGVSRYDEDRLF